MPDILADDLGNSCFEDDLGEVNFEDDLGNLLSCGISPALFTNTQTFYAPAVVGGDFPVQFVEPDLFVNNQTFFQPLILGGAAAVSFGEDGRYFGIGHVKLDLVEARIARRGKAIMARPSRLDALLATIEGLEGGKPAIRRAPRPFVAKDTLDKIRMLEPPHSSTSYYPRLGKLLEQIDSMEQS